jgi:hypothetical protein
LVDGKTVKIETLIGIACWVIIFLIWYVRTYPEKFKQLNLAAKISWKRPKRKKKKAPVVKSRLTRPKKDFRALVETVEAVSGMDPMGSGDAATMVQAVQDLLEIEPASGQMWEALARDALEHAQVLCDDCKVPVRKTVKKTGIKIECDICKKWLALKNSKVTVIDPRRADLEDWEH